MLREDGPRFKLCRRKLGTHQIASTNLAPIIVQHASDSDLVFNARTCCLCVLIDLFMCVFYVHGKQHTCAAPTCTLAHTHYSLPLHTVKVATFLTMPLTPGELSFNIQVCMCTYIFYIPACFLFPQSTYPTCPHPTQACPPHPPHTPPTPHPHTPPTHSTHTLHPHTGRVGVTHAAGKECPHGCRRVVITCSTAY